MGINRVGYPSVWGGGGGIRTYEYVNDRFIEKCATTDRSENLEQQ